jgi:hypothetical protein
MMRTGGSAFHHLQLLPAQAGSARWRDLLLKVLEQVRRHYQFVVVGYVVMPEHVHLLISEPERKNPSIVIQAIKLSFTRRVLAELRRRRNARQASLSEHAAWQGCSRIFPEGYYPMSDLTSRFGLPNMTRGGAVFPVATSCLRLSLTGRPFPPTMNRLHDR